VNALPSIDGKFSGAYVGWNMVTDEIQNQEMENSRKAVFRNSSRKRTMVSLKSVLKPANSLGFIVIWQTV